MNPSISPWRLLRSESTGPDWFWLPGWSFTPEVFAPLYDQLPGRHYGAGYPATAIRFNDFADSLASQTPATPQSPAIWIGWSLGGALACAALSISASTAQATDAVTLITLATSATFCRLQAEDPFGLDATLLQQFSQNMQRQPEKTRRRFLALCTQGAADARSLSRQLAASQTDDQNILLTGLDWLSNYHLPCRSTAAHIQQQHWLGCQDALNAGGLNPVYYSPGRCHAFFLEPEGQAALLTELRILAGIPVNGGRG